MFQLQRSYLSTDLLCQVIDGIFRYNCLYYIYWVNDLTADNWTCNRTCNWRGYWTDLTNEPFFERPPWSAWGGYWGLFSLYMLSYYWRIYFLASRWSNGKAFGKPRSVWSLFQNANFERDDWETVIAWRRANIGITVRSILFLIQFQF